MLALYRGLATALGPAVDAYLRRRIARGKEDPARISERRGLPGRERPPGPLVWLHAASVGEAVALLALVERLRADRPDLVLLVTTGTVTSAATMARRLPDGVIHQFVPVDRPAWVRRFLRHWRPDLGIWIESDLWPILVTEARAAGARLALVDARMSDGAFRSWRRAGRLASPLFTAFERVLASSALQADRFRAARLRRRPVRRQSQGRRRAAAGRPRRRRGAGRGDRRSPGVAGGQHPSGRGRRRARRPHPSLRGET